VKTAGLKPAVRYAVFHSADELKQALDGGGQPDL
jgi:hypothetical protein